MVSSLVVETRRGPATARGWPLALLILILALFVGFSTAIAAEKKGFVILPNKAPHFGPIGDETTTADILATHEQTGGSFGVWRYTSDNRSGPPLHIHHAEDEFFYVVKGKFDFQLDDCITRAPAGSFVFIPKEAIHTFRHVGPEPGVLLGTVHPAGFEGLFRDLPGADVEGAKALFTKYHMEVVGPPLEVVQRLLLPPVLRARRCSGSVSYHQVASPRRPLWISWSKVCGRWAIPKPRTWRSSGATLRDRLNVFRRWRPNWFVSRSI